MDDTTGLQALSVEEIYELIGELIVAAIPEEWVSAFATVEVDDDGGQTYGRYRTPSGAGESESFPTDYRLFAAFLELRERMHRPPHAPWRQARFQLSRDGTFDFSLDYQTVPQP